MLLDAQAPPRHAPTALLNDRQWSPSVFRLEVPRVEARSMLQATVRCSTTMRPGSPVLCGPPPPACLFFFSKQNAEPMSTSKQMVRSRGAVCLWALLPYCSINFLNPFFSRPKRQSDVFLLFTETNTRPFFLTATFKFCVFLDMGVDTVILKCLFLSTFSFAHFLPRFPLYLCVVRESCVVQWQAKRSLSWLP